MSKYLKNFWYSNDKHKKNVDKEVWFEEKNKNVYSNSKCVVLKFWGVKVGKIFLGYLKVNQFSNAIKYYRINYLKFWLFNLIQCIWILAIKTFTCSALWDKVIFSFFARLNPL